MRSIIQLKWLSSWVSNLVPGAMARMGAMAAMAAMGAEMTAMTTTTTTVPKWTMDASSIAKWTDEWREAGTSGSWGGTVEGTYQYTSFRACQLTCYWTHQLTSREEKDLRQQKSRPAQNLESWRSGSGRVKNELLRDPITMLWLFPLYRWVGSNALLYAVCVGFITIPKQLKEEWKCTKKSWVTQLTQ